ncbi:hypothetical protein ACFOEE_14830 [Pseudoalteromonas fenneropenaei]|uniref:HDOD domain-containing protein n=1 Tax=Pseudoalteromonas fenneropenaei TaxID=1737459 RepID=A0ABV7CM93_9GAMM
MKALGQANALQKLIERTHQLLQLYYHKQKWPHIIPLISQLSEAYWKLYQNAPHSLQAQLQLYIKSHGYTTNLVVNQQVLILVICTQQGFGQQIIEELLAAGLANYLCVTNENNALARGEKLNPQAQKQWQFRHHLAIKLLSTTHQPSINLKHILARLQKYTLALEQQVPLNLYDQKTLIVALAELIARKITPSSAAGCSLQQALAQTYLESKQSKAQTLIRSIVSVLSFPFPGQLTKYKQYHAFCLHHQDGQTRLCVFNDKKQFQLVTTNTPLQFKSLPVTLADPILCYGIWFADKTEPQVESDNADTQLTQLQQAILALGQHEFVRYQHIEKTLDDHPQIISRLQIAASQYNKQQQKAANLRHSLTMVGLDNAALLCQRVLLESALEHFSHPLMAELQARYSSTLKVITVYAKAHTQHHFEQLASPFTAFLLFILSHYNAQLRWQIPLTDGQHSELPVSYGLIYGIQSYDKQTLTKLFHSWFTKSANHNAFLVSELDNKSAVKGLAASLVFIKLATYKLLMPEAELSAWQTALIQQQLKELMLPSFEHFQEQVLALGPYNPI